MSGGGVAGLTLEHLATIANAELRGDPGRLISGVATLQDAAPGTISFLANKRYKAQLRSTRASAVVLSAADAGDCPVDCLIVDNPYLAHAKVVTAFHPLPAAVPGVHPSAVVDPTAQIAPSVQISAGCFIGARTIIEDGVVLGPGCVLLDDVHVGAASRLVANVTLCAHTDLGERCLIHPATVIGADGFGLANDDGAWFKVPQVGRVCIGNDVEIGASSTLDRGAIGDTVIADGVKIDDQVHIAHNVQIGAHTAIAGCVGIAGSARVGAYCTIAGFVGINGHVEIADRVHISGATAVTRSIREPGVYTGTVPAIEHASWMKNFARLRQLDDMARRIKALEKELAVLHKSDRAQE